MKLLITENQFRLIVEAEVPNQVRRRIYWIEDYLNYTLEYLDSFKAYFNNFVNYLDKVIVELVDRLYHGWFSDMDDKSDEWIASAKFIEEYTLNNFYDKIKKHYFDMKQN